MARPTKQGLDYFPFDVGFFGDKNVRILKARYQSDGIAVYVKLLCDVYEEGYFLPVEDWEDYIFVIADELLTSTDKVEQIITFLQSHAMIRVFRKGKDELTGLDVDAVITSHGIQKRYVAAMKSRRRKDVDVKRGFWLLSEKEEQELSALDKCGNNEGFYSNNPNYYGNNPDKSRKNDTKEKKSSTCTSSTSTSTTSTYRRTEEEERAKELFFQTYPQFKQGNVDDSMIDYAKLLEEFARSKDGLQTFYSFSYIVKVYDKIIAGEYMDWVKKPVKQLPATVQAANERTERERFYSRRRSKAENRAEHMKEKAMQSPRFVEAERELRALNIELVKAELKNPEKLPELQEKQKQFKRQRVQGLLELGLTEKDLRPKWHCPKCSDTGFLPGGHACDCYNKEGKNV